MNDVDVECGREFEFFVDTDVFRYTQSIEAGSAIRAGFKVFRKGVDTGITGEADFGGSLRVVLDNVRETQASQESTSEEVGRLFWERKAQLGLSGQAKFPGFTAESEFTDGRIQKATGLSLDLKVGAAATQAYRYTFPGNPASWPEEEKFAFASLLFPSVAESDAYTLRGIQQYFPVGVFDGILKSEDSYRLYRTGRIGSFAITGKADAVGFKGSIDFKPKAAAAGAANPEGAENKSTPVFDATAAGSAELAITYEKDEQVIPSANTEAVGELIHTMEVDGKYNWNSSYTTSFVAAKKEIDEGPEPDAIKEKAVELLTWLEGRLSATAKDDADGGIRFRVFAKPVAGANGPEHRIRRLEVGFRGRKKFGFNGLVGNPEPLEDGDQYRINFVIEGEGQAERLFNEVISKRSLFVQLLSDAQKQRTNEFLNDLGTGNVRNLLTEKASVFTAQDLYDHLVGFVRHLFDGSGVQGAPTPASTKFYEEVRHLSATETDFGIAKEMPDIGFTVDPFRLDLVTTHDTARGKIFAGTAFVTEDYSSVNIKVPNIQALLLGGLETELNKIDGQAGTKIRQGIEKTIDQAPKIYKETKAFFTGSSGDVSKLDLVSWPLVTEAAAPVPSAYRANTDAAPAGKPRYGIGDFYSLTAEGELAGPIGVEIRYEDSELSGLAESALGLYRWRNETADWQSVPSTLDMAGNRVTASVTEVGLYTLGVRMPAGRLTWTPLAWSTTGTGGSATTSISLEATGVRNNDGSLLAPGALVHVQLPGLDEGQFTFATSDASSSPGLQVAADGSGRIRVDVTLPGSVSALKVVGFSDIGTAFGEATVVRP